MSALSEVLWSPKEKRSWEAFEKKLSTIYNRYDLWGANYSTAFYDMQASILPAANNKGVQLKLSTKDKSGKLTYGVEGKHYQKNYTTPVLITSNSRVLALYTNRKGFIDTAAFDLTFNKATGKKITLATKPSNAYPGDGAFTLVNGLQNTAGLTRSREFLGFNSSDLEATIDLGSVQKVEKVIVHTLTSQGSWIYAPSGGEVWTSADGKTFKKLESKVQIEEDKNGKGKLQLTMSPVTTRFVKVIVNRLGTIPQGKPGYGNKAWLFADEIEIH